MKLSANKNVEQICVVGHGIPQPIALVVLSEYGKNRPKNDLIYSLKTTMNIVNNKLDNHEKLNSMILLKETWTIDNGKMTPTMKIKRNEIEKKYQSNYINWYESQSEVICELL